MFQILNKLIVLMIIVVVLAAVLGTTAGAALVSINDPVFGVGAITRDTATGLDWLDVPLSVNRSFIDVAGQFGTGGDFEGYRHASGAELFELYENAGIPDIDTFGGSSANISPAMFLIGLVGSTTSQGINPETFGLINESPFKGLRNSGDLDFLTNNGQPAYSATVFNGFSRNEEIPVDFIGHWLVRPVPIPSSLLLLATGLTILGGIIRRRKSAGQ